MNLSENGGGIVPIL